MAWTDIFGPYLPGWSGPHLCQKGACRSSLETIITFQPTSVHSSGTLQAEGWLRRWYVSSSLSHNRQQLFLHRHILSLRRCEHYSIVDQHNLPAAARLEPWIIYHAFSLCLKSTHNTTEITTGFTKKWWPWTTTSRRSVHQKHGEPRSPDYLLISLPICLLSTLNAWVIQ